MKKVGFLLVMVMISILAFSAKTVYAGNIDTFGVGAKATALGGAFSAKADDFSAMYYNPAGLVQIKKPEISLGASVVVPNLNQSVSFKNSQALPLLSDQAIRVPPPQMTNHRFLLLLQVE